MMDDMLPTNVICPGQRAMFKHGNAHFLRVVFMAYWQNASPSSEVFYLTGYPMHLSPTEISMLEDAVAQIMMMYEDVSDRLLRLTYLGYSGVEMSESEIETADWRV